jgi:hypothetical protein
MSFGLLIFLGVFILFAVSTIIVYFSNRYDEEINKNSLKEHEKERRLTEKKEQELLIQKKKLQTHLENRKKLHDFPKTSHVIISDVKSTKTEKYDFSNWKSDIIKSLEKCHTVSDLLIIKEPSTITYGDLLLTFEWRYKRLTILLRDSFKCKDCGVKNLHNHIHHNYYIQDWFPWDVFDDGLVTLCKECHTSRHQNQTIPVYAYVHNTITEVVKRENPRCSRCGGTGYIPQFWYHYAGVCFKCEGNVISNSVFEKVLNNRYGYLDVYDKSCKLKRAKAVDYIKSLTDSSLINKLPNYKDYILKEKQFFWEDDYEDELPF